LRSFFPFNSWVSLLQSPPHSVSGLVRPFKEPVLALNRWIVCPRLILFFLQYDFLPLTAHSHPSQRCCSALPYCDIKPPSSLFPGCLCGCVQTLSSLLLSALSGTVSPPVFPSACKLEFRLRFFVSPLSPFCYSYLS